MMPEESLEAEESRGGGKSFERMSLPTVLA
jgi:hypothetical protein